MPLSWNELQIGTETGRVELVVTDQMIDDYLALLEIDHAWLSTRQAGYSGRIAPPDMLPKLAMRELFQNYVQREIGLNMRAKQTFKFLAPISPGMTVKAIGRLTEKYERRGRRFIVLEALFTAADGTPLLLDRRTQYVPVPGVTDR